MKPIEAYPLTWPVGWPRKASHQRQTSQYKVTLGAARDALYHGLRLMHARGIVISSDLMLRHDGIPLANQREPLDPGIAVYWTDSKGRPRAMACDVWRSARENMRALGLAVECLRGLDRTGASEMLERAFSGFAALPAAAAPSDHWRTLGLTPPVSRDALARRFRHLAHEHHPDRGGDSATMARINDAYRLASAEVSA